MREVLDGWLALGTAVSTLVIFDDLHSVVKAETEVRVFATWTSYSKLMPHPPNSKMTTRILVRLQSRLCTFFASWPYEVYLFS